MPITVDQNCVFHFVLAKFCKNGMIIMRRYVPVMNGQGSEKNNGGRYYAKDGL